MASNGPITDELLSAYLDNAVTEQERALIEEATARDPDVAWRLSSLRYTVDLLHQLPDIAPPRTLTLADLQAAGMLDDKFTVPMTSSGSSAGRLGRLRAILSAGNPVWRNAALVCAALLVAFIFSDQLHPSPRMSVNDTSTATTSPDAAPRDPPPRSLNLSARESQTTPLPPHAVSVPSSTANAIGASARADAGVDSSGEDVDAIAEAGSATIAQDEVSAPQETIATEFYADGAPADVATEGMAVVAAAAQESAAMVDEEVTDETATNLAPMVPDTARESDGDRAGVVQSMSLASPGSTDDLQALSVPSPPPAAADVAPMAALSMAQTTATSPTITVTDAAISSPAVAPLAAYVAPDTIGDRQMTGDEAVEPAAVPPSTELPAVAMQPDQDAPQLPVTGKPADVGDEDESVSPVRITNTPERARVALDTIAMLQLALAVLVLLFALLWLLSIRRGPPPPSSSIDQWHRS